MRNQKYDMRIVEITVAQQNRRVWLTYRLSQTDGGTNRDRLDTVMVKMDMAQPCTDVELLRLAGTMANYVISPSQRYVTAPKALVWRQVSLGNDVTRDHGKSVDDRHMPIDPLPLDGGFPDGPDGSTILSGPKGEGQPAAKRRSASAREPQIRKLGGSGARSLPGG